MKKIYIVVLIPLIVFGLIMCDNGVENEEPNISMTRTGIFIDSPVYNIGYRTESQNGVTDRNGAFLYNDGEMVTFFIGDLEFPTVMAQPQVTPMTLASTNDINNQIVINIARLLQSLDQDGIPSNGIEIAEEASAFAKPINFDVSTTEFENSPDVIYLVENTLITTDTLISIEETLEHLNTNLSVVGTWLFSDEIGELGGFTLFDDNRFMFFEAEGEEPNGMESGTYSYDAQNGTITFNVTFDNNDNGGINSTDDDENLNNYPVPIQVSFNHMTIIVPGNAGTAEREEFPFEKQSRGTGIAGTWLNEPSAEEPFGAVVLLEDGRFLYGEGAGEEPNGMEAGTYIYDSMSSTIAFNITFDSNSDGGISPYFNGLSMPAVLNGNILTVNGDLILNRQ